VDLWQSKDLFTLTGTFLRENRASPCNYGFLKDLLKISARLAARGFHAVFELFLTVGEEVRRDHFCPDFQASDFPVLAGWRATHQERF
jgi:hypothetical protein